MPKLYEITGQILEVSKLLESADTDSEIEAALNTIEAIEEDFADKAENIVKLMQNNDSDIQAVKNEIERLTNRKKSLENSNNKLKSYLTYNIAALGKTSIKSPVFAISLRKGVQKLEIIDQDKIPEKYFTAKVEMKLDKKALLADLKTEELECCGAIVVRGDDSLIIK